MAPCSMTVSEAMETHSMMAILQAGVPKSGNFWLYRLLQSILQQAGVQQTSYIKNHNVYQTARTWELSYEGQADIDVLDIDPDGCHCRISSAFRERVGDIDSYVSQCSHVWTHSAFCSHSASVLPKFDKVVYIVRDPRDVAISMAKYAFTPYCLKYHPHGEWNTDEYLSHRLDGMVRGWVRHVGGYLEHKDDLQIHFVFYERMLAALDEELAGLLRYLGIALAGAEADAVKQQVGFAAMKRDNPRHVRRGVAGSWRQVLTDDQKAQVDRIAGGMFGILGYPMSAEKDEETSLPRVPARIAEGELRKAVARSRRTLLEAIGQGYRFAIGPRTFSQKLRRLQRLASRHWPRGASLHTGQ
jgi:aryl sulfotransferase